MRRNCTECYLKAIFQWMLLCILQGGILYYSGCFSLYDTCFIILGKLEWLAIPLSVFLELLFQKVTHTKKMIGILCCSMTFCTFANIKKMSTITEDFKKISDDGVTEYRQLISVSLIWKELHPTGRATSTWKGFFSPNSCDSALRINNKLSWINGKVQVIQNVNINPCVRVLL